MKVLVLGCSLLLLASCMSTEKMLGRTWKIDKVDFMDSVSAYNAEQKAEIVKQLTHNMQFTFMPDSVYTVLAGTERTTTKWWLSGDKKTLFTTTPQQRTVEAKILKLKKNYLEFVAHEVKDNNYKFACSPIATSK